MALNAMALLALLDPPPPPASCLLATQATASDDASEPIELAQLGGRPAGQTQSHMQGRAIKASRPRAAQASGLHSESSPLSPATPRQKSTSGQLGQASSLVVVVAR